MAKGKRTKEQTTIYKTLHKKTEDQVTRTQLKTVADLRCSGKVYYYKVHTVDRKERKFPSINDNTKKHVDIEFSVI